MNSGHERDGVGTSHSEGAHERECDSGERECEKWLNYERTERYSLGAAWQQLFVNRESAEKWTKMNCCGNSWIAGNIESQKATKPSWKAALTCEDSKVKQEEVWKNESREMSSDTTSKFSNFQISELQPEETVL